MNEWLSAEEERKEKKKQHGGNLSETSFCSRYANCLSTKYEHIYTIHIDVSSNKIIITIMIVKMRFLDPQSE